MSGHRMDGLFAQSLTHHLKWCCSCSQNGSLSLPAQGLGCCTSKYGSEYVCAMYKSKVNPQPRRVTLQTVECPGEEFWYQTGSHEHTHWYGWRSLLTVTADCVAQGDGLTRHAAVQCGAGDPRRLPVGQAPCNCGRCRGSDKT